MATSRRHFMRHATIGTAGLALAACRREPLLDPTRPPNIVVYLADSLRADGLGCYGNPANTSPNIDAFARGAYRFSACYSQSNWTKPSIASLYTGLLPRVHKAAVTPWRGHDEFDEPPRMLPNGRETWVEAMAGLGYQTAVFQTNPHPREEFGYGRGADYFDFSHSQKPMPQMHGVDQWLQEEADGHEQPFFAFVHQIDPHGPYRPSAAHFLATHGVPRHKAMEVVSSDDRARVRGWVQAYTAVDADAMEDGIMGLRALSPAGAAYLRQLYDAQVHAADEAFGHLLTRLAYKGVLDNTVVVLTSDHGEGFNEHGSFCHASLLYNPELHVPLLIGLPGQRRGMEVPHSVALFDLNPTTVMLGGGTPDEAMMARPLLDHRGRLLVDGDRTVVSEQDTVLRDRTQWGQAIQRGRFSVVRDRPGQPPERAEAYDTAADPWQQNPKPLEARMEREGWDQFGERFLNLLERHKVLAARQPRPAFAKPSLAYEEEMRALGYL